MTHAPIPNPAHSHDLHPPRGLLMACGALILLAVIGVGATRLSGAGHVTDWRSLSVATLPLVFEDGADGSVIARAPDTGAIVHAWAPETGGFVRTSMRSLAVTRKGMGIGAEPAFILHRTANDKLILEDPATGEWVSLDAFGGDNVGQFASLFEDAKEAAQ